MSDTPNITAQLREEPATSLPDATPIQVNELQETAIQTGAAINRNKASNDAPGGLVHFLSWTTSSTYLCGADAVGRRNTARDTDHWNTTCIPCMDHPSHPFSQEQAIEANDR